MQDRSLKKSDDYALEERGKLLEFKFVLKIFVNFINDAMDRDYVIMRCAYLIKSLQIS